MRLLILLTWGGLALAAQSVPPQPAWTLTGNAGLFSDYRYRGFTQTDYQPSFQGGFDVAHRSGFYLGSWNANVDPALYRGATLEMDLYGGYKFAAGPVGFDLGAITYRYPTHAATGKVGPVHHEELYAGLSFGIVTARVSYQLSNYFGLGDGTGVDTRGSWYLDLGAAYGLGDGWSLNAHYGHQTIHNATAPAIGLKAGAVDDAKVGLAKEVNGWVLSAAWIGTSRKAYFSTGLTSPEGAGRSALVAGCSRSF